MDIEDMEFGRSYQDKITGFTGVLTGKATYMHAHPQGLLEQPVQPDGKTPSEWINVDRIEPDASF